MNWVLLAVLFTFTSTLITLGTVVYRLYKRFVKKDKVEIAVSVELLGAYCALFVTLVANYPHMQG